MVMTRCNLCGCEGRRLTRVYESAEINLAQCPVCSLVVDDESISGAHSDSALGVQEGIEFYFRSNELVFRQELRRISKVVAPPARMLDFGCGTGMFLKEAMGFGFDAFGVELNTEAVDYVRKNDLFPVFTGIDEVERRHGNSFFDVIILSHTLEHISDPMDVLTRLEKLLGPSGLIVIIVPCYSRLSLFIDRYKRFLVARGHQYYFTRKTLGRYLEKAGYGAIEQKVPFMGGLVIRALGKRLPRVAMGGVVGSIWGVLCVMRYMGLDINLSIYARKGV